MTELILKSHRRSDSPAESKPSKVPRLESDNGKPEESHHEKIAPKKEERKETSDACDASAESNTETSQPEKASTEWTLREEKGDLFSAPETSSLAHCVSADLHMGKGIAATFKNKFGRKHELAKQGKGIGEVAILKVGERFVYYLVTKEKFGDRPPEDCSTLERSLEAMRDHCLKNKVTSVAMPRIGCGLDGLNFEDVKKLLHDVFGGTNITVTIYSL